MDFYEVVRQILELLQRQGRVSYRALKRQFSIDDDYIEDLKEELLYAHESAVQADDRGFKWTGETDGTLATPTQPDQPEPQPVVEQTQPVREPPSPVEPHTPDAERRQLTVMFVDLVGSTSLSGELDPEDYREVVRQYQQVCSEVIQRYDGHIAQYLGDGLLVYFGYPQAHEDDAQRAIHTGLGIVEAIGTLNDRLEQAKGIRLAVRLGIHTGLVVVGEMGGEGRQEQLALGETPNVAARIQGLAEPNTLIVSDATYRLIRGYFECESMGEQILRGLSDPIAVYRVLSASSARSRLDIASTRGLTPLVGREQEVGLLLDRWGQVTEGQGQVVLLSGEAGIGKSRLVQVLKDHVAEEPHTRLECRSSPYFTNSALYPIIDMVQRTLRFQADDTSEQKLEKLTYNLSQYHLPVEETVPLFGALLSLSAPEDQYPPLNLSPQRQRQKTLEAILAIMLELAEREPVLFILEDLHWTDPTTLEFIELLIDQAPTASVYILLTCRPELQPPWSHRSYLTEVTLSHLSRKQIERLAEHVADGKRLPAEVLEQITDKTDGVPLYVEEMTKSVLESGVLKESNGHYELMGSITSLSIPATLQDSLMARLDRLVTAKAVAQYASVIGRQFSYELLQAVSDLDEGTLQRELGRLVEAELVYRRGLPPQATYTFKHALIQDTAYQSLLRSTRQGYHQRIAQVLEVRFPEMTETQPELLAHHYMEAGLNEQAVGYWQQAGEKAVQRSANVEVIAHLTQALELLKTLPETSERIQQEVTVQIALGRALIATKGSSVPETADAYTRAYELSRRIEKPVQRFRVLRGLFGVHNVRAEFQTAFDLAEELLTIARQERQPELLAAAHYNLGTVSFFLGKFVSARTYLEEAITLYNSQPNWVQDVLAGQDYGVGSLARSAETLWTLGYPDQAVERIQAALNLTQTLSHPLTLAFTLANLSFVYHYRREVQAVQEWAEAAMLLSTEQGFQSWWACATCMRGWALAVQGHPEEGITRIGQGLDAWRETEAKLRLSYYLALLAEAYGKAGQAEEGLSAIVEALGSVDNTDERFHEAELQRLKGELLLQQSSDNTEEAETQFHQAITIAQSQSAKSWELRAATSLSRLWQSQGKRQEAYDLLAPVYGWFSEGFDTADLIDAKALLDELA